MKNIVITLGGTKEPIDNVRNISNSSSGKLGIKIAQEIMSELPNSNLFLIESFESRQNNCLIIPSGFKGKFQRISIKSTADLEREVREILMNNKIDIFIHSMAVADYSVDTVIDFDGLSNDLSLYNGIPIDAAIERHSINNSGKISSSIEQPAIILKKNPKIIKLIKELSPRTFLVGFKLLDSVTNQELFNVGFDLLRKNRCNLVIANDINLIRQGKHMGMIIYPEKSSESVLGKDNIAKRLAMVISKRAFVKHPKSIALNTHNGLSEDSFIYQEMKSIGSSLFANGYLPEVINHDRIDKIGTYGNMSVKSDNGFYITSRNVHKGYLSVSDISCIPSVDYVEHPSIFSNVHYCSVLKPSIDTSIHDSIYKDFDCKAILHIHTDLVFLGIPYIDEMFPCGSMEERDAILQALQSSNIIQMKKHGIIVIGKSLTDCFYLLQTVYQKVPYIDKTKEGKDEECLSHIQDVKADFVFQYGSLYSIYLNDTVIGCIWEDYNEIQNSVSFGLFSKENVRGKKLGLVSNYLDLYDKQYFLYTMNDCNIKDFYINKYNFEIYQTKEDLLILRKN